VNIQREEIVFTLHLGPGGWRIDGPTSIGPFHSKDQALDLANGMVQAIRAAGERARVEMQP
jgi:hypothetical protein